MARYPIRDQVAIIGLGSTGFSRDAGERSSKSLACEASIGAIHDAGLEVELSWIDRFGAPFPVFRPRQAT